MDSDSPRVALLDDGELDDVRAMLCELGVSHCHARHATLGERVPILFSTPAHARALAEGRAEAPRAHLHAVVGSDAEGLDAPADLQLLRPLEPTVLRLLTRRETLTSGYERRLNTRVALGTPVKVRVGDDRREVIVSQISIGGCALISPARVREGTTLEIDLPPEISARRSLQLTGRVVGSREVPTADGPTFDISVAFDTLDLADRVTLRAVMARHAIDFRPGPRGRGHRSLRDRALPPAERRHDTRRRFQQRLMGVSRGVAHVLMAHDLSPRGLRIEPNERLALGDAISLAVFGMLDARPLLARAVVERFDDIDGGFLRFADLGDEDSKRVEALLETLAPIDVVVG